MCHGKFYAKSQWTRDIAEDPTDQSQDSNCQNIASGFSNEYNHKRFFIMMSGKKQHIIFIISVSQETSTYSLWRFAPTSPSFRRSTPTPHTLFDVLHKLLIFPSALRTDSSPSLRRFALTLHLLFGALRQLLTLSSAIRADSSYSLWRFAPTPHSVYGAPRQLLTFSSALRADSSYFLWRFAPICRNLFGAPRRLLTFPNPPQPQKPDF